MATMNFTKSVFIFSLVFLVLLIPNANAAVIFSDDFNDGNANGWSISPFCPAGNPVVSGGHNDSYTWSSKIWQSDAPVGYDGCFGEKYFTEMTGPFYVHYWLKFSSDFLWPTTFTGVKSTSLAVLVNDQHRWICHFALGKWNKKRPFFDVYNDPDSENYGGIPANDQPNDPRIKGGWATFEWQNDRWYEVEWFMQLNTVGKADGILRLWVDGVLLIEDTGVRFRLDSRGIDHLMITNYVVGSSPAGQIYTDNITVSTTRVGGNSTAPKPPTGLRIVPQDN